MTGNDTIVALSTPPGVGGVALLRICGPQALPAVLPFLSVDSLEPRHSTFARFLYQGEMLDEVLAIHYPAPHSYTGEDTVEIACHGSLYIQQTLLQALTAAGLRLAEPGEYTRRAFLNGKLNLSQAEAVADLIDSVTPAQHRLAVSQLRGGYAEKLRDLRQQLLDLTSLLELELDFSQEDVEFADRSQLHLLLSTLQTQLAALLDSFRLGNALKQGVPVAIIGRPNVGKSTLLNALLNDDRAIVSDIPGTTRDTVEGMLTLDGITFRLVDTAGLRETEDAVEQLGIERSRRAYDDALIVLHVEEANVPIDEKDLHNPDGKKHLLVINKTDLTNDVPPVDYGVPTVVISALQGTGIEKLKKLLTDAVGVEHTDNGVLLSNARHCEALSKVCQALDNASQGLDSGVPADLVAVDLRDALYHLGTITGEVTSTDILGNIFSRFCVGK